MSVIFYYQAKLDQLGEAISSLQAMNERLVVENGNLRDSKCEEVLSSAEADLERCKQELSWALATYETASAGLASPSDTSGSAALASPGGKESEALGSNSFKDMDFVYHGCRAGGSQIVCSLQVLNNGASLRSLEVFTDFLSRRSLLSTETVVGVKASRVALGPHENELTVRYEVPRGVPIPFRIYFPDQGQAGEEVLHLQVDVVITGSRSSLEFKGGTVQ